MLFEAPLSELTFFSPRWLQVLLPLLLCLRFGWHCGVPYKSPFDNPFNSMLEKLP
jgi:hypothetical protein